MIQIRNLRLKVTQESWDSDSSDYALYHPLYICSNLLASLGLSISNAFSQHSHGGICTQTENSLVC